MNSIPKKNFVLYIANTSRAFETFKAKNCINEKTIITKIKKASKEKTPKAKIIIVNHKVNPADTVKALTRGDDSSISNRINECY